jgi:hypothetical protein
MKSGKQRKSEIKAHRKTREAAAPELRGGQERKEIPKGTAPCNPESLAPSNSYGVPEFVQRGHYMDVLFQCATCLKQEIWSATRQKWWYEVAKGSIESRAKLCNSCRRVERERISEARRVHLEGVTAKLAKQNAA